MSLKHPEMLNKKTPIITPHLGVYKIQVNSLVSIIFRMTSVVLIVLAVIFFILSSLVFPFGFLFIFKDFIVTLSFTIFLGNLLGALIYHTVAGYLHYFND